MSHWRERISSHPVWQQLDALGPSLDEATKHKGIDASSTDGIERIRTILTFTGKRLAGADPVLVYPASLDTIADSLQNTLAEIKAFIEDGDVNRVIAANSHADAILLQLPAINYPFVADDWMALRDAGASYRETLEQNLQQVNESVSQVQSNSTQVEQRISELAALVENERTNVISLATDFETQFSTAQETRNQQFLQEVENALSQIRSDAVTVQQGLADLTDRDHRGAHEAHVAYFRFPVSILHSTGGAEP